MRGSALRYIVVDVTEATELTVETTTIDVDGEAVGAQCVWPAGPTRRPGVVVLHDAFGVSDDLRRQLAWLASEGFAAVAPDLYRGRAAWRCMVRALREVTSGRDGDVARVVHAAGAWTAAHERCTGHVGVIGFCMGGGFALMVAPSGRFGAASVNYGVMPAGIEARLPQSCALVGSYGGADRTLPGVADRVRTILDAAGVPHDVEEYPGAGHGFLNDHAPGELPWYFASLGRLSGSKHHPEAAADARRRIVTFLGRHLSGSADAVPGVAKAHSNGDHA